MTTKDDDKGDEQKAQRSKNISSESRTSQEFKKRIKKKHAGRRKEVAPSGVPGQGKEAARSGSRRRSMFFKFLLKGQNDPFTKIAGCT